MLTQCSKNMDMRRPWAMRTGVARCYKHDTNTYDVSMGYGFMLLKKEMQTTDKTCILRKTFMSGPQNFIIYDVQGSEK